MPENPIIKIAQKVQINIVQIDKMHKCYCGFGLFIVRLLYKLKLLKRT